MFEHEVVILERRLTARHLQPLSTIFDLMIDKIDEILMKTKNTNEQIPANELERMKQLKNDIIHQSIIAGLTMVENFRRTVAIQKEKYFL
jgi:hypothetical protein